ncbi:MAG: diguanylate phosphodiesterase [Gammaproteobacteria bacterium]|nr:diguanylate phosphodiesterase [Pseudohongiella sp.]MAO41333.1 diguanylate phosphodiesterase [Pseudohongiella sp.]MAY55982.1 diguanylate phosphodiesterase [Gammaproteobacteria bacterium]|tara:strand:+ start:191 stop:1990 length:1800 start_codon:yes stop_codon:yes gene_type:complete
MSVAQQFEALQQVLRDADISVMFQPIVSGLEKKIVGYEALSRGPSNSPLHSPLTLFSTARYFGLLTELEMLCRAKAIFAFAQHQFEGLLFINVSPESLLEQQHPSGRTLELVKQAGMTANRLVIELTEHAPIDNVGLLQNALHHYRSMGFAIAIDDLGAGYSGLRLWTELKPEYVKIDRHFINGIHKDTVKREFVGSILTMAKASRSHIIAEGVEHSEEFNTLAEMGVEWMQGYWFERPSHCPQLTHAALGQQLDAVERSDGQAGGLHSLVIPVAGVHHRERVVDVLQRFQRQPSLNSLAVLDDNNVPLGSVHCHALSQVMLKPYAMELHGRKPIAQMLASDSLIVDVQQSLQRVSRLLTSRARQRLEEDFIITDAGQYAGLGRVIDVLRQITELQVRQAQSANPLTLLPGNVSIHECLDRLLKGKLAARLCYIDIDSFKPFNDIYGYGKGDEILLGLAQILKSICDPDCDFVGHIGGDDFMLVLRSDDWHERLDKLNVQFQQLCRRLYRSEHLTANGFEAPDRDGNWRTHPLLNLSIGVLDLTSEEAPGVTAELLAEYASNNKHLAKKRQGFSVEISPLQGADSHRGHGIRVSHPHLV